jgi:histidine triad (HIT) family protein
MKKKLTISFVFSILVICFFILLNHLLIPRFSNDKKCVFCDKSVIEYQKFYEDEYVVGIYNYKPLTIGHCLFLPKRHVESFDLLSDDENLAISKAINKTHLAAKIAFNVDSYLILQKNGIEVGQTQRHLHFHYIPRQKGQRSILSFLMKFLASPFAKTISKNEMSDNKNKLIENIR